MDESKKETWKSLFSSIFTFAVFVAFVTSIPAFCAIYIYVRISRYLWLRRLERKNPDVELVRHTTVRTAMDTYRCQGLVTVLLQIHGQCDIQLVKQKITEDVLERKNRNGSLRFPHMKRILTSCLGRYAWIKDSNDFDINNHIIHVTNPVLRNRIVTSANIQEYVSDAITKYLPPWNNTPPWQILLITTEPDKFYILARVHHLYISEDGLSFTQLLMIKPDDEWISHQHPDDMDSIENVLNTIYTRPKALPVLYNHVCDLLANTWNELISAYDPLQNSCLQKSTPNIFQFNMIMIVTLLAVAREYVRSRHPLMHLIRKEMRRRQIDFRFFVRCFINTLYPFVIIRLTLAWMWWFYIKCLLHLPITMLHLISDTPVYMKWIFISIRAVGEVLYIFRLMYTAPRILLEELILPMFTLPRHHLQKVSLSGRKVVCWTDSIPIDMIRYIRDKTGAASCEIQLYAVAAALHEYFQKYDLEETDEILTTARFIPQEHLLKSANRISSGLLCLPLPMKLPADDPLYGLHMMQLSLQNAMSNQTALYLASLWQYDYGILTTMFPSALSRMVLYVLSARYSIMMTQIEAHTKEMKKRHLVWGQEVESFIYWRPPQANISLSLSLINYGDEMRFAVMADAELAPHYTIIVSKYESYIKQLQEEAQNYSNSISSSRSPSPTTEL